MPVRLVLPFLIMVSGNALAMCGCGQSFTSLFAALTITVLLGKSEKPKIYVSGYMNTRDIGEFSSPWS